MTDRELMQQALEALQYASEETKPENLHGCDCLICKTINALRDRLAQPEHAAQPFWDLFDENQRLRAELKFNLNQGEEHMSAIIPPQKMIQAVLEALNESVKDIPEDRREEVKAKILDNFWAAMFKGPMEKHDAT